MPGFRILDTGLTFLAFGTNPASLLGLTLSLFSSHSPASYSPASLDFKSLLDEVENISVSVPVRDLRTVTVAPASVVTSY